MTNPPSWRPQGSKEAIGLGVASAGKSIPRPLPGKVMAGLAGAIVAALGVAAYAASDFLDIDRTETASIASDAAVAGGDAAKPRAEKPIAPTAKPHVSQEAMLATATQTPPPSGEAKAPVVSAAVEASPRPASSKNTPNVSDELRKEIMPTMVGSTVFKQPASADHVAGLSPDVAVAESEAEVAKLEAQIGMGEPAPENEMEIARLERAASPSDAALAPQEGDTAAVGGPYIPVSGLQATRVTRYVNLRDGPADEAKVIAVIPTNATVQAETNCGWCAVTYNGQSGYIYKGFLSGRGGSEKSAGGRSRVAKRLTGKPGLY